MNPLRLFAAYIGVVLLWSTTPLAIKWSGEGPGYLFGATARMSIGLVCVLLLQTALRQPLPFHRKARLAYLAGAVQIYGSMLATYWASQFIPSGWISVVFGLTPLITALMAAAWLGERNLTPGRLLAYGLGIAGLAVMFDSALEIGPDAAPGIGGVLLAAFLQSASAVWIKRINAHLPALTLVAGSLLLAVPAYLVTWSLADCSAPPQSGIHRLSGHDRHHPGVRAVLLRAEASAGDARGADYPGDTGTGSASGPCREWGADRHPGGGGHGIDPRSPSAARVHRAKPSAGSDTFPVPQNSWPKFSR